MRVEHLERVPTPTPRLMAVVLTLLDAPVVKHPMILAPARTTLRPHRAAAEPTPG